MFRLPAYQELTREQIDIHNLPTNGKYLVIGPPGSGKTVIAIYRAEMLKKNKEEATLIVYNQTLKQYLNSTVDALSLQDMAVTFHGWFPSWYRNTFHERVPTIDKWTYDWDTIFEAIGRKGSFKKYPHLIIDEGQDFPPKFYMVMNLLISNTTVFADENQRITENQSTLEEIKRNLSIQNVSQLSKNFRNSRQIAEFACQYYCDLASGMAELPDRIGPLPHLIQGRKFNKQMQIIAQYSKNHPDEHIGVFIHSKGQQYYAYEGLTRAANSNTLVQMYISSDVRYKKMEFSRPGITIVNYKSTKGLEFDAVFLPDIQSLRADEYKDNDRMKLFVMCSRARNELFLLSRYDNIPPVMQHVPKSLYTIE